MQRNKTSAHFSVYQLNNNLYGVFFNQTREQIAQLIIYPGLSTLQVAEMLADIVDVYERYGKILRP